MAEGPVRRPVPLLPPFDREVVRPTCGPGSGTASDTVPDVTYVCLGGDASRGDPRYRRCGALPIPGGEFERGVGSVASPRIPRQAEETRLMATTPSCAYFIGIAPPHSTRSRTR